MLEYNLIKERLKDFEKTDNNKLFIQYLIILKCISILEFSQETIVNGKGSLIAPQLREVFEYTIILAGFDGFVSLSEFINHEKNDQFVRKIRNKMESFSLRKSKYEGDIFRGFTKILFDTLSEYTHANIDNLMRFAIDFYSSENEKLIFVDDAQIMFDFVNNLFLMAVNSLLELDTELDLLNEDLLLEISKRLKPNHLDTNEVYNRILSIESIRTRYINKLKIMKSNISKKEELNE